jgi:hypothetical protein
MEVPRAVSLYRIAYVSASQAHSVVRELAVRPVPGDRIALAANTVVTVREIVAREEGDTIAAEVAAEVAADTH